VIEGDRALGREDPELAAVVLDRLRAEGVTIIEGVRVSRVAGGAGITATLADSRIITGSHILVAAGRKVALDSLNLDAAGVAHDAKGVTVNASLRSSNRRVYAVGDAAGGAQFTHLAGYHAGVVIRQMLFALPAKASMAHIPRATYTDPELAQVGLTEAEARKQYGDRVTVLRWPFHDNDRARAENRTEGLIKVMAVKGRPVGVGIAGAQAGELIALWALALSAGLKMGAVAGMVMPYPTLGEVSKRAAGAYFSPRLFDSPTVKQVVRLVQRWLP